MFNTLLYASQVDVEPTFMEKYSMPIMFILIFVIFYFLMIRPQNKKRNELLNELKTLKKGDKILLNSGIFGVVESVGENNTYYVMISNNVQIHVVQGAIAQKISTNSEGNKATDTKKVEQK